ncbi:hypothetical protein SK128_021419, partial [Halocaridina rubra]
MEIQIVLLQFLLTLSIRVVIPIAIPEGAVKDLVMDLRTRMNMSVHLADIQEPMRTWTVLVTYPEFILGYPELLDIYPEAIEWYPFLMRRHPEYEGKFRHLKEEYDRRQAMGAGVVDIEFLPHRPPAVSRPNLNVESDSEDFEEPLPEYACEKSSSLAKRLCFMVDFSKLSMEQRH